MRKLFIKVMLFSLCICISPLSGLSAQSGWNEAGVRIGIMANSSHESFTQYDAFAVYGLPYDWRFSSGWCVTPHVTASLGVLVGGGETGFIGSAGPALVLNKQTWGVTADLGINASVLDRRYFGNQDFGSILQFGAYVGVQYRFSNGLKIGYHLQHSSNGHIIYKNGTPNPGLDLHIFGISSQF